jgi:hypothetical protein
LLIGHYCALNLNSSNWEDSVKGKVFLYVLRIKQKFPF